MSNLREFISARRSQLNETLAAIEAQRVAIVAELAELEAAETALASVSAAEDEAPTTEPEADAVRVYQPVRLRRPLIRPGSIKSKVLQILRDCPNGADAAEILRLVNEISEEEVSRPSLSPQLSRLKDDGWVSLEAGIWRLLSEGNV